MVAFNFKPQFVPHIENGKKQQTIRSTKRCEVGDDMQLYTGQRTKQCRLVKESVCVDVYPITISEGGIQCEKKMSATALANRDGFNSAPLMRNFFRDQYGLPYKGWVHVWK